MKKRILLLVMSLIMIVSIIPMAMITADAAVSIEDNSVFLKQQTNYTCTLVSATMMVRRTAILSGLSNWESITESSMRKVAWLENQGLRYNFSYTLNGTKITVKGYENGLTGSYENKKAKLISLLNEHPEGVVIYNHYPAHAVLLTKYVESTDTFYCADPAPNVTSGQITLANSSLSGSGQTNKISNLDTYWIVTSPKSSLPTQHTLTIYYDANGGYTKNPEVVGTRYKVNNTDGITVRSGPSTGNSAIGGYTGGSMITVTETVKKSDYTWGKIDYKGQEGWVALGSWMVDVGVGYDIDYCVSNSYVCNIDTGSPVSTTWKYGVESEYGLYNCSTFGLYKDGYTFVGWSLSSDGSGTIFDQDAVKKPEEIVPDLINSDYAVTLFAIWKKNACSHNYISKNDNNYTWEECSKCGDIINKTETACSHQYTIWFEGNYHWQTCNYCGQTINYEQHTYDFLWGTNHTIVCTDGQHYYECTLCSKSYGEKCVYDNSCDT